jgi:hypothetical protein
MFIFYVITHFHELGLEVNLGQLKQNIQIQYDQYI